MNNNYKFPDEVYVCFDLNGKPFVFTDLDSIPVYYGKDGIKIAKYTLKEVAIVKDFKTYEVED